MTILLEQHEMSKCHVINSTNVHGWLSRRLLWIHLPATCHHDVPSPSLVLSPCNLHLLSSQGTTGTPPPLVVPSHLPHVCRLVVTTQLVALDLPYWALGNALVTVLPVLHGHEKGSQSRCMFFCRLFYVLRNRS